jgi:hypothetical protein
MLGETIVGGAGVNNRRKHMCSLLSEAAPVVLVSVVAGCASVGVSTHARLQRAGAGLIDVRIDQCVDRTETPGRDLGTEATRAFKEKLNLAAGFTVIDSARHRLTCDVSGFVEGSATKSRVMPGSGASIGQVSAMLTDTKTGEILIIARANSSISAGGPISLGAEPNVVPNAVDKIVAQLRSWAQGESPDSGPGRGDSGAKSPEMASRLSVEPLPAVTMSEKYAAHGSAARVAAAKAIMIALDPPLMSVTSVRCLEQAFRSNHPHLSVASGEKVRNELFPLLDAVEPRNEETYLELLRRPTVAARLMDINIRYVAIPRLVTQRERMDGSFVCGGSGMGAGCLGAMSGKVESMLSVQVLDLATGNALGEPIATTGKGTSWAVGVVVPIWHNADAEEEACSKAASEIVKRLPN